MNRDKEEPTPSPSRELALFDLASKLQCALLECDELLTMPERRLLSAVRIFISRTRKVSERSIQSLSEKRLADVLKLADARLDEPLSLDHLAAAAGVSRYHFCRVFKAKTGLSPHRYVMAMRIERATRLLTSSCLSLAEIAYTCGFSSQAHMTDLFRKHAGLTPGLVRKMGSVGGAPLPISSSVTTQPSANAQSTPESKIILTSKNHGM